MVSLIIFLAVLLIVGIAGYVVITKFELGRTALMIFGVLLLLALLLFLFGGLGGPAVIRVG